MSTTTTATPPAASPAAVGPVYTLSPSSARLDDTSHLARGGGGSGGGGGSIESALHIRVNIPDLDVQVFQLIFSQISWIQKLTNVRVRK